MDNVKSKLRDHCAKHNSAFIEADFSYGSSRIMLEPNDFLRSIEAEQPRVVYWGEDLFHVDEFIEAQLVERGWDPDDEDEPDAECPSPDQVKTALAKQLLKLKPYEGAANYLIAVFPCHGSLVSTSYHAPWAKDLISEIAALVDARESEVAQSDEASQIENVELLKSLVQELLANDAFRKTKGLNKRLLLATKLIGDRVPHHHHGSMTRIAQNGDLSDLNLVMVVKEADEKLWLENSLPVKLA